MTSLTGLALAAQRGDRRALARFVEATQADVWRYCAWLTDSQSADDVTQDTFVRAIGSLGRFRADSDAKVWLLSIARRAAADHIRQRQRRTNLVDRLRRNSDSPDRPADHGIEVASLVASLEPERRDAFVLTQILGLSYQEAAEVCRCPVGTIRSRVARARDELVGRIVEEPRARDLG